MNENQDLKETQDLKLPAGLFSLFEYIEQRIKADIHLTIRRSQFKGHKTIILAAQWMNPESGGWASHSWNIDKYKPMKEQFNQIALDVVAKQNDAKKLDRAQEDSLTAVEENRMQEILRKKEEAKTANKADLFDDLEDHSLLQDMANKKPERQVAKPKVKRKARKQTVKEED